MSLITQVSKLQAGMRAYGWTRTVGGLMAYLGLRLSGCPEAAVVTRSDGLLVLLALPRQDMPTLIIFQDLVEPEYTLLKELLHDDSVFVDVGCGIGTYAISAAKRVSGIVHAFEPTDEGVKAIHRNARVNGVDARIRVNQVGLSNRIGQATFKTVGSLYLGGITDAEGPDAGVPIALTTLDDYCLREQIERIDVLKIDVEGHECEVLEGAAELIAAHRIGVILAEVSPSLVRCGADLISSGFRAFYYHQRTLRPVELSDIERLSDQKPTPFHSNVVLIHESRLPDLNPSIRIDRK